MNFDNNENYDVANKINKQYKRGRIFLLVIFGICCLPFALAAFFDYLSNPEISPLGPKEAIELRKEIHETQTLIRFKISRGELFK